MGRSRQEGQGRPVVVPMASRWEPRRSAADMRTDVLRRITDQDITERSETVSEEFASDGERFALAVRGANDGLWDWDVA